MHFGEFNPLEVLAAAAVQRGGSSQEASGSEGVEQGQGSASELAENEDNPDDNPNEAVAKASSTTESITKSVGEETDSSHRGEISAKDPSVNVAAESSNTETSSVSSVGIKENEGPESNNLKPLSVVTSTETCSESVPKTSTSTPSYVIKMVTSNGNKAGASRSMMALKDATKIIIPNKDGSSKTLTVLKINKPVSNRASSSIQILNDKPKGEDDEGYCSRSSLDSPGQCSRSDSELCEQENADLKSPGVVMGKSVSPLNVRVIPPSKNDTDPQARASRNLTNRMLSPGASTGDQAVQPPKKPAKIVIVSRDSNIKNMFSEHSTTDGKGSPPVGEPVISPPPPPPPQGGTVLRSLLGEKSVNKADSQQAKVISPTNGVRDSLVGFTTPAVTSAGIPESKLVNPSAASSSSESHDQLSPKLRSQGSSVSGIDKTQGPAEELKREHLTEFSTDGSDTNGKGQSPALDTNRNCLSSPTSTGCDILLDHEFKVPSNIDSKLVKSEARAENSVGSCAENKSSTVITRSSENTSCTTPSTVVRIVCANKTTPDDTANESVEKTPVLPNGSKDNIARPSMHNNTDSDKLDNSELVKTPKPHNVSAASNSTVSGLDEESVSQASESFQNAFRTFLSNGKPVDLADLKGLHGSTTAGGGTLILPQSVLASLNPQNKVTVVAGGPASQLVTSLASQVLATSHTSHLSKGTMKQASKINPQTPTVVVAGGKEDEEIVDVMSLGEVSSPQADPKESLKLASSLHQTPVTSVVKSIPANNNLSLFTSAISSSSKGNAAAKTIPVLINTTNGKRLASVPVTTLVSASTGQSQKPVTYLVMPPQGKGGASLLLPQQLKGQTNLQHTATAAAANNIPRYQYIIQDDVPPVIQPNSAPASAVNQQPTQTLNLLNMGKSQASDSWTVLATVDTQGIVSTPGHTTLPPHMAKSKTVPVLIKKPVASDLSLNTSVLHNSIVVSSKGPQSLIPKLMAQPVNQLQKSFPGSLNHSNLLVNPNDILKTECLSTYADNIVKLKSHNFGRISDKDMDLKSSNFSEHSFGDTLIDSSVVQSSMGSSQLLESSGSDMLNTDKTPSKTPLGGRGTPSITGRITPLHSLETTPAENTINIKITGSKVIDMRTSEDLSKAGKKQTQIGKFGSLSTSWSGLQKSESVPVFGKSGLRTSSPVMFDSTTTSPTSSVEPWSPNPMSPLQIRSDSELDLELLARPCPKALGETRSQAQGRRKLRGSTSSTPDLSLLKESQGAVSRLHPLIDHDYCKFEEFSADIQSSIIATTESKKKIEKYNQKAKAARTKESIFKVEKNSLKMKKRKYTHRLPLDELRKIRQEKALERRSSLLSKFDGGESLLLTTSPGQITKTIGKIDKPIVKRQAALEKKIMSTKPKRRDNKSYVKITGSFQDDFVYYATKNTRGRPRKYHDSTSPQMPALPAVAKKQPVGGINVFDWYRDLSKTDKSSKFGVPEDPLQVSSVQEVKADPYVNGITDKHLNVATIALGGHTPVHESEVADLVMQMMPTTEYNAGITSESEQFIVSSSQSVAQSETVVASAEDTSEKSEHADSVLTAGEENPADLENMVEQVRSMLNSMGEAELTMLSENLSHSIPTSSQGETVKEAPDASSAPASTTTTTTSTTVNEATDYSSLNAFLGPYSHDAGASTTQGPGNSFDLDDINDSDLLPSDIGNMNMILGDLNTPKTSASTSTADPKLSLAALDSPVKSSAPLSLLFSDTPVREGAKHREPTLANVNAMETDKNELFLEVEAPVKSTEDQGQPVVQTQAPQAAVAAGRREEVQRPPELTTVSMFWNDLPGLMIHGKQCVRLVDIHKQMLPAKDTGILKKRCQMMNLEITNCSELERDFLIRYANAAKSKSCVVVAKPDAQALVSFYVNPRPRVSSMARQSTGDSRDSSTERPSDRLQEDMGPGTPATVCSEYEAELDCSPSPKYTGGKGKGKGKSSRPHSASSERASTPGAPGKGKGKGGGKGAQKRKLSPQIDLGVLPTTPTITTPHAVPATSFTDALPSVSVENKSGFELSHPSTPQPQTPTSDRMFVTPDSSGIKRSERTRNRKVNYAALNAGMYTEEGSSLVSGGSGGGTSQLDTQEYITEGGGIGEQTNMDNNNHHHKIIKVGSSLLNRVVLIKNSPVLKTNTMANNLTLAPVEGQMGPENRYNFQEEIDIRRLRNKQKRRGLTNTDKKKLKRLRERLRVKVMNLKRKIDNLKKNNGLAISPKKLVVKDKSSETEGKCEEIPTTSQSQDLSCKSVSLLNGTAYSTTKIDPTINTSLESLLPVTSDLTAETVSIQPTTVENKVSVSEVGSSLSSSSSSINSIVSNRGVTTSVDKEQQLNKELKEASPANNTRHHHPPATDSTSTTNNNNRKRLDRPSPAARTPQRMPLRKVIFPVLHRSNQRGRMQVGNLHYHMYRSRESSCIQCTTCSDFLSLRKFLKHMHHHNIKDELCTVSLPHKLEMAVLEPSADQTHWWGEFEKKRAQFEAANHTVSGGTKNTSRTDQRKNSKDRSANRRESRDSLPAHTSQASKAETVTQLPQGGSAGEVYCVKVEHPGSSSSQGGGVGGSSKNRGTTALQGVVLSSPTASSPGLHLVKVESQNSSSHHRSPTSSTPVHAPVSVLSVPRGHNESAGDTDTSTTTMTTYTTPDTSARASGSKTTTRQSTRVRKRKQLHPIESYVYTSKSSSSTASSSNTDAGLLESKRLKTEEVISGGPESTVLSLSSSSSHGRISGPETGGCRTRAESMDKAVQGTTTAATSTAKCNSSTTTSNSAGHTQPTEVSDRRTSSSLSENCKITLNPESATTLKQQSE